MSLFYSIGAIPLFVSPISLLSPYYSMGPPFNNLFGGPGGTLHLQVQLENYPGAPPNSIGPLHAGGHVTYIAFLSSGSPNLVKDGTPFLF